MASKYLNVVSKKEKGEVSKAGKEAGKEARRPALGDISNVVPADKQPANRPVTRAYAKLLADAQAVVSAGTKNTKKDEKLKKKEIPPEARVKRVNSLPISQRFTNPSKDSKDDKFWPRSKSSRIRRSLHTLTYVLNFRSKDATGLRSKSEELVFDLGEIERGDQFDVIEYVEDLYVYYKQVEDTYWPSQYMSFQRGINPRMREILMSWIMDVHEHFDLRPETLYLSVYIFDRYLTLQLTPVRKIEIQLIGLCSILLASKYEEIWSPCVSDLIHAARNSYTKREVLHMEKQIINKLGWYLTVPTPYMFLIRFVKTANDDKELEHMMYFFAELALINYPLIKYAPSLLAASCVFAARGTLSKSPIWSSSLTHYTGYSEPQIWLCARLLLISHAEASEGKFSTVYKKYSKNMFGKVALRQPVSIAECMNSKPGRSESFKSTSSAAF